MWKSLTEETGTKKKKKKRETDSEREGEKETAGKCRRGEIKPKAPRARAATAASAPHDPWLKQCAEQSLQTALGEK